QTKRWLSLETLLEQAIERYPRSPAWPRLQALAEMQQGNIDEAVGKFEHAFELQPTPKALAELTEALITAQRSDEAIEMLRAHVELTQQVPPLLAMRGRALAALNQPEQARNAFILAYGRCQDFSPFIGVSNQAASTWGLEQAYEIALEATQDRHALWIDLALAALEHRLGRYSEAYSRLLQLEPQFRPGAPAGVQPQERDTFENLLASCAHFAGNYEHARDAYRRVLERVPDNMAALNNLAFLLAERLDDAEAALPLAQRAAAYATRDANVQDTLGWVQFHAGQSDAALQTLLTSLELEPIALTYYHVAEVYLAQGQSDRAVQMFEFAAETAEKSNDKETLDKATQRLNELTQ
ncbi:MAG: tetratricopeptide repeat protein, partial [Phycisphaeraceae bacterium]